MNHSPSRIDSATDAEQAHGLPAGANQAKRFATARAAAALKGYALHTDPHGGYYVTWRGLMQCFESLEEFEEWFERVTGSVG